MFNVMKSAKAVRAFFNDRRGVTAMEYGLIAALVAVGILGSVRLLGTELAATFKKITDAL